MYGFTESDNSRNTHMKMSDCLITRISLKLDRKLLQRQVKLALFAFFRDENRIRRNVLPSRIGLNGSSRFHRINTPPPPVKLSTLLQHNVREVSTIA
jgi:hypothetical protein